MQHFGTGTYLHGVAGTKLSVDPTRQGFTRFIARFASLAAGLRTTLDIIPSSITMTNVGNSGLSASRLLYQALGRPWSSFGQAQLF